MKKLQTEHTIKCAPSLLVWASPPRRVTKIESPAMLLTALKLARSRSGNFAVMFALLLPALAAIVTFIGDQANMGHIRSRINAARGAAGIAVAHEYRKGNKSHGQLEAYAKAFFVANLGVKYEKAVSVKLIVSGRHFQLETHVRYEPWLAPLYAAASSGPGREYFVDIQ
jgi:hypothetical protein